MSPVSKHKIPLPKPNLIDRLIGQISPRTALERLRSRAAFNFLNTIDGSGGYQAAGSPRRSMRGWLPSVDQTADEDTLPLLEKLRASSRDLYSNTPPATAALKRVRTNVVGSGLLLQSRVDRRYLGLSDEEADAWETNTEREFNLWAESKNCDMTRFQDFAELQALAFLSTMMNGDAFVLLPMRSRKGDPYSLRVMLVEADMVCNKNNAPDSVKVAGGIELDDDGAPVRYWIRKRKGFYLSKTSEWVSVDAFGRMSGRRNVLHLMERERVGQRRGIPFLSPVIEPLKQATRLSEAELMASVISAFFTVFVRTSTGSGGLADGYIPEESVLGPSGGGSSGSAVTSADNNLYEIGSGNIIELGDDQDISIADPKRPNDNFDPFFTAIIRQVGASLEIPYEQLMLAFTASYSASRAALLEAWKFYRMKRRWIASNFCQPVYEEWLAEAVELGRVVAPGFFEDPMVRKAWCGAIWGGPGQGQIDPVKETSGAILRIANNLSTYEDEFIAINGGDWESAVIRRARENRILADNGLEAATAANTSGGAARSVTAATGEEGTEGGEE